ILISVIPNIEKEGTQKISKENKQILFFMVKKYFSDIDNFKFKDAVESVKTNGQKSREWWNKLTAPVGILTNAILNSFGLSAIEIKQIQDKEFDLGTTVDQMKTLQKISEELGFYSIYILVDKVDENELTGAAHLSYAF